ncbi:Ribosome biogenesis protein brx1 [Bachmanniomyces sp. S44760]|nr:Ribosome biogenesis protein brx1 [Bachmanniomyces sp. S44760]
MASVYKSLSKTNGSTSTEKKTVPKNKQRVLILSSRGVTYRHRHLLNDLYSLLPHSRKDAKLDTKSKLYQLNELAELYNCNNVLFFEARKGKDLYIWMSKAPNGPTVKMHLQNLHTMSELHFPGNCLKGSRPILSFDSTFNTQPYLLVVKELLTHIFGVPKTSRKIKPFIDHVMGFTLADGKIWIRCFQINETEITSKDATNGATTEEIAIAVKSPKSRKGETKLSLTEIGPRFVLTPIVILESSFGGPVIYENKEFVSPNQIRSEMRLGKAGRYARRSEQEVDGRAKMGDLGLKTGAPRRKRDGDELEAAALFA